MDQREQLLGEIRALTEREFQEVLDYVAFVKTRARLCPTPVLDKSQLAALYAEFSEEDRDLAEA